MPFSIFVALSILGLDFMIYVLFKLTYGDRRGAIAREVAAQRKALGEPTPRPFLVSSREVAPAGANAEPAARSLAARQVAAGCEPGSTAEAPGKAVAIWALDREDVADSSCPPSGKPSADGSPARF